MIFTETRLLIQLALPSFLSSDPHSSSSVTLNKKTERLCHRKSWVSSADFQEFPVKQHSIGIMQAQNTLDKSSVGSCCRPLYQHWPMGGTAQMQRAGAVGGRLNWSSTVLERAGSITVISLQEAGPETTHTEHWQKRDGYEVWKNEWHEPVCASTRVIDGWVIIIRGWL